VVAGAGFEPATCGL